MIKPRVHKWLFIAAGVLAIGLGTAGIFLPLLPTMPFLLVAAACFIRSSDKLYRWLITHRWFGSYIRNYREHKAITKQSKVVTLVLLWGTIGYTGFAVVSSWVLRIVLLIVVVGVTIHILSLRTLTKEMMMGAASTDDVDEEK